MIELFLNSSGINVIVDLPEATIGVGYPQNRLSIKWMKGDLHKPEATIGAGYSQNRLSVKWMRGERREEISTKHQKVGIIHHWIILSTLGSYTGEFAKPQSFISGNNQPIGTPN
jgi:hypothetical protein